MENRVKVSAIRIVGKFRHSPQKKEKWGRKEKKGTKKKVESLKPHESIVGYVIV